MIYVIIMGKYVNNDNLGDLWGKNQKRTLFSNFYDFFGNHFHSFFVMFIELNFFGVTPCTVL